MFSVCFPVCSHNVLLVSGEGWLIGAAAQGDAGVGQTNVVTPVVNAYDDDHHHNQAFIFWKL